MVLLIALRHLRPHMRVSTASRLLPAVRNPSSMHLCLYIPKPLGVPSQARSIGNKRAVHASAKRHPREAASAESSSEIMSDMEFEAIINDQATMKNLRKKLVGQMKAAAAREQLEAASELTPFDSDEYDYAEVDRTNPQNGSKPSTSRKAAPGPDSYAEEAAARLAAASLDILEGLDPAHAHKATSNRSTLPKPSKPASKPIDNDSSSTEAAPTSNGATTTTKPSSRSKTRSSRSGPSQSSSSSSSSTKEVVIPATAIGRVAESSGNVPVAILKKGKAWLFEAGSPMVYGGAIDCVLGRPPPEAGDVVVVADAKRVPLAWGVYNPASMFRVRIMQHESECLADDSAVLDMPALIQLRVTQAVALRKTLGYPSDTTDVFRLINNEGDRLSGVTADQLGETVVVQSTSAWSERYKQELISAVQQHTGCKDLVWRPIPGILKEEGIEIEEAEGETAAAASVEGISAKEEDQETRQNAAAAGPLSREEDGEEEVEGQASTSSSSRSSSSSGKDDDAVVVKEGGVKYLVSPRFGQKTGFYADQRESRAFIGSVARGKTLLDLCCYSGGFAIAAAAAGALAATGVDSSGPAIDLATRNAELNGLSGRCSFFKDDVAAFLRAAVDAGHSWDIVILDPPKLAPNKGTLQRAAVKYRTLNTLALSVVRPGGLLMTCSCSGAMTQSGGLAGVVAAAAAKAERQVTLLRKAGAAVDHPLHPAYQEGEYLTNLTYRVY